MSRQAMGATILLAWGAGLLWLVQRRGASAGTPTNRAAAAPAPVARVSPAAAYYRLAFADSTAGFALLSVDTSATAVEMVEQIDLRVPDGDSVRHLFQRTSSVFDRRLVFSGVDVTRRDGPARWVVSGRRVSDSSFAWLVSEGDTRRGDTLATDGPALASSAALALAVLRARPPRVGDVRTVRMADPVRRGIVSVQVAIAGDSTAIVPDSAAQDPDTKAWRAARWDTLRVWRLVRRGGGPPLDLWVDEDGFPVIGDILPGIRAERQPFEMATAGYRAAINARFPGLGGRTASPGKRTAPRPMGESRVLLRHVGDSAGWAQSPLVGGTQELQGDTLAIRRAAISDSPTTADAVPAPRATPALPDTITILAARIRGSSTDPAQVIDRLVRWVRTTVAAAPDSGPADPLRALRQRRGGPSDRAALLVQLARASGLEARTAGGLVALSGGRWARHAWAEVRLGDWVPVDPTFGTFPAGGGYLRLMQDVPADPLYLVPLAALLEPQRVPEKAR
jgi:transglutaminase-like putative cysteine protease